jgi:SOS-response transcriptional repressor LexA
MKAPLTDKQEKVYAFIVKFSARRGRSPIISEIMRGTGIQAPSSVTWYLNILENTGRIKREPVGRCNNIIVTEGTRYYRNNDKRIKSTEVQHRTMTVREYETMQVERVAAKAQKGERNTATYNPHPIRFSGCKVG